MSKDDYNATIRVADMKEQMKREKILISTGIFAESVATRIAKSSRLRRVSRNTVLTTQGQSANSLFIINLGLVKCIRSVTDLTGKFTSSHENVARI